MKYPILTKLVVTLSWTVSLSVSLQVPPKQPTTTTQSSSPLTCQQSQQQPHRQNCHLDLIDPVYTLLLCRHGDSIFNGGEPGTRETFTGWMDVPLSQKGIREAKETGRQVAKYDLTLDACFTSTLQRAQLTAHYCLWAVSEQQQQQLLQQPQTALGPRTLSSSYVQDYRLNERHYGALQGYVKADVEAGRYGHDPKLVQQWRRSWHTVPPLLNEDDPRRIRELRQFSNICGHADNVPRGESLEQVANTRIRPFLNEKVIPILKQAAAWTANQNNDNDNNNNNDNHLIPRNNATGLVVAHANSLRALMGVICEVQHDPVALKRLEALRLPTGVPLIIKFRQRHDGSFQACDLEGYPYDLYYVGTGQATPDLPVWPLASLPSKKVTHRLESTSKNALTEESPLVNTSQSITVPSSR
ncbi:phosphoglyceromutase [Nitzschia inconspicua]|uniref:Phosphoglyceromutase n=1 Tax=Nitzschia inconspicua TaxID=303405 RepID=A0A9K3LN76_9STRA|nr:phosphoglyceromutase [Nitzschia inconspicua]